MPLDRYVQCPQHPDCRAIAYIVCIHVKKPEDVAYLDPASKDEETGVILCAECVKRHERRDPEDESIDHLTTRCVECLREAGILKQAH